MSRKLKKRIRELCGLEALSKEERTRRCNEILNDNDLKQSLCNQVPGLTFRDIDKTLKAELSDKKLTPEQEIYESIEEDFPDKLNPNDFKPKPKRKVSRSLHYTREESLELINANTFGTKSKPVKQVQYDTYSQKEIEALINGTYTPHRSDD